MIALTDYLNELEAYRRVMRAELAESWAREKKLEARVKKLETLLTSALEAIGDDYEARDADGANGEQLRDRIVEALS